jgi:hypothetical protein
MVRNRQTPDRRFLRPTDGGPEKEREQEDRDAPRRRQPLHCTSDHGQIADTIRVSRPMRGPAKRRKIPPGAEIISTVESRNLVASGSIRAPKDAGIASGFR